MKQSVEPSYATNKRFKSRGWMAMSITIPLYAMSDETSVRQTLMDEHTRLRGQWQTSRWTETSLRALSIDQESRIGIFEGREGRKS